MQKIIVTLGPATNTIEKISMLKSKGVDFVRINMSHSNIKDLKYFISLSKEIGLEFIIDTEGSQVRTGTLTSNKIHLHENDIIRLYNKEIIGNEKGITLKPGNIINQLKLGDILYVDFDALVLRINSIDNLNKGYIEARVLSSGYLGKNKAVVIDPKFPRNLHISTLTAKDIEAIDLGVKEGIKYVAASFMHSGADVKVVKKYSKNKMKIISKIECKDALNNLDEIIYESDYLLIDRGDLSKEIPVEKIPLVQKIILQKATKENKGVFVATNLLESMIINRKPTRAEVHDIISTIQDGAYGLVLAAETAVGDHPIDCVNMLSKLINHSSNIFDSIDVKSDENKLIKYLEQKNYLLDDEITYSIVPPHGGRLVNRYNIDNIDLNYLKTKESIKLTINQQQDATQIAMGAFSPLKGFMNKTELNSVLDKMQLPNGLCWPIPIILDIDPKKSNRINEGDTVALISANNNFLGYIVVEEKYSISKELIANRLYGTNDLNHPGVRNLMKLNSLFIGGEITLFETEEHELIQYSITPKQTRRLFEEKNWTKVVGFHTRNVIHRAHEFIQLSALEKSKCDGIFLHPVIGNKKSGDFNAKYIVKSYEIMQKSIYPKDKIVFGVFSNYSRFAGAKEAIFTAICRKNFGCSHFVIGRDHTGVGGDIEHFSQNKILSRFSDLGIELVNFNTVYYSKKKKSYVEETNQINSGDNDRISISGTDIRKMFNENKTPPEWYMRPEISKMILKSIKAKKNVFIK